MNKAEGLIEIVASDWRDILKALPLRFITDSGVEFEIIEKPTKITYNNLLDLYKVFVKGQAVDPGSKGNINSATANFPDFTLDIPYPFCGGSD